MKKPLRPDESTALADTQDIKCHWVEAVNTGEYVWKAMTEEDEVNKLSHRVVQSKEEGSKGAPASAVFKPAGVGALVTLQANSKFEHKATQAHKEVTQSVVSKALQQTEPSPSSTEVVVRIWDCGGQPVFLDILSAFLTKRTMFLLLFDASLPLKSKYQGIWRHKGKKCQDEKQNITILQLMMQWMQLIHASLVAKDERGIGNKETEQGEATQNEATVEKYQSNLSHRCPRIMIVGTHGDKVLSKQQQNEVLEKFRACKNMPVQDILEGKLIIDNTTAGKEEEDPGYKNIRKKIYDFANYLTVDTPNAWLSFRKVLKNTVGDRSVLLYEEVIPIAKECGIPKEEVPSVLHFYHQLGVFLHYTKVKSLQTTIIVKPQWLIQHLCKLLLPEMFGSRPEHLTRQWNDLEGKGVLEERLYRDIWEDCGLEGGAQALVDLLEHFDLAKEISSVPKKVKPSEGRKYFVPCMLKARSQRGPMENMMCQEIVQKAETLHITFTTGYIPPGFFVRLAVRMISSETSTCPFERGMYRDSITFRCGELDRVTISESESLESVQVDFIRVARRKQSAIHFADSCLSFRKELSTMCKNALSWFPSIEHDFAFRCSCSEHAREHFAIIDDDTNHESHVFCRLDRQCRMNSGHKYWLQGAKFTPEVTT